MIKSTTLLVCSLSILSVANSWTILPAGTAFGTHTRVSTTSLQLGSSFEMQDIMSCASDGVCSIEDMQGMIEELEDLNSVCSVDDGMTLDDCNDESLQVREMLKEALAMRLQLSKLSGKIHDTQDDMERESTYATIPAGGEDHAFDHYVDYRSMAQYESH